MALVVNDRVKETSTTTGTVTFTLDGAVAGFETFSSAIGNSNTTYYAIEIPNSTEFEVGLGTVSAGQLARTQVFSSSNSDALVDFSAGTKNVFCTLPASKAVIEDASNNVTLPADLTVDTDTLYVDSSNNRVGIGTTSPARDTLHVHSTVAPGTYVHLTNSGTGSAASDGSSIFVDTSGNFEVNNRESANIRLKTGSLVAQTITTSGTVINEDGASVDFRVEGDNDANLFFVDGSTDRIGIGTLSPGTALHMRIDGGDANLLLERSTAGVTSKWGIKPYNDKLHFRDESVNPIIDNFTMTSTGRFGIGTSNPNSDLHIASTGSAGIFIQADTDNIDETHVPFIAMAQDSSTGQNFKIGIEGNAGTEFTGSLANAPYIHAANATIQPLQLANAGSMIMTLGDGKVGIGTSSPSTLLHLSSSDPQITITDTDGSGSSVIKNVTDDFWIDSPGDINLDAAGGNVFLRAGSGVIGDLDVSSFDFVIRNRAADTDIIFKGNDGGSTITALTLDISEAGAATFNDKVILGANKSIEFGDAGETISGDGTDLTIASSNNTTIDSVGSIFLDADNNGLVDFKDGGTTYLRVSEVGNDAILKSFISDGNFLIKGNDGGVDTTALTFDMSAAGDATFNSNIFLGDNKKANFGADSDLQIYHDGSQSIIEDVGTGQLKILAENTLYFGSTTGTEKYIRALKNGIVELSYDNSAKLTTSSTGIDVTGTAVTDGLTVAGNVNVDSGTIKLDGNYPTGTDNVALGDTAFDSVTSGSDNTVIGSGAGTAVTTGQQNTVVGSTALNTGNATGNTAIGFRALRAITGANNVGIGRSAGHDASGGQNTFVGGSAGYYINGTNNVAVGYQAGNGFGTTGSSNIFMGYRAGDNITNGSNNIIIGTSADASSATASNEITLGDTNITSLRIPGLQSGASSGDVLTYDGTDITLSAPTGVTAGFVIAMSIAL